mgnify:CR=1 FL=1
MKITKQQIKQVLLEQMLEVDSDGDSDDQAELNDIVEDIKELVGDFDIEFPDSGGFFLSLVRESGKYLGPREQELAQEMRNACVQILLTAKSNAYKARFPRK